MRFAKYPFVTYDNASFVDFMIMFLRGLQPRHFNKSQIIYEELDSPDEIYFVMEGCYDIGYALNNCKRWRLQFGERTSIGGFNLANEQRIEFNYRAHNNMKAYALRRNTWKQLCREHEHFTQHINLNFVKFFSYRVFIPLTSKK